MTFAMLGQSDRWYDFLQPAAVSGFWSRRRGQAGGKGVASLRMTATKAHELGVGSPVLTRPLKPVFSGVKDTCPLRPN